MNITKFLISCFVCFFLAINNNMLVDTIFAQGFSGNDPSSYQCFDSEGKKLDVRPTLKDGVMTCEYEGKTYQAVLKPVSLQQLEIWFIKIVYFIWAFVATFSFVLLLGVAYQYMISRNAGSALAQARQRIFQYILGFALVFLAVPILSTMFRLLGVDDSIECYSGLSGENNVGIGFQFIFADLCTDPKGKYQDILGHLGRVINRERSKSPTNPIAVLTALRNEIDKINGTACDERSFRENVQCIGNIKVSIACVNARYNVTVDFPCNK